MKRSKYYNLRLPERGAREGEANDAADIEDLTYDLGIVDEELERQRSKDEELEKLKATKLELAQHQSAAVLDHPDDSVTDAKIGERTVLTTSGTLQELLTAIGAAVKAAAGTDSWNAAPATTLKAAKAHMDSTSNPHAVTKAQVGLGNVPNVSTNSQTPTYTAASSPSALTSGETLAAAFGKLAAAVSALISHLADGTRHITSAERTGWNGAVSAQHTHANKALLDTYTQTEEDLAAAVGARHSHANKSVLDGITAALTGNWNAAYTHISDAVKHITSDERTLWNTVSGKLPLSGGTLTGFLTLHAAPTANLHAATKKYVDDKISAAGGGDMLKSVYDADGDGVVDNAEKVNGLTVQTAVPAGAKFTDTVYTHPASGVTAGTYRSVTVNAQGHVTAGSNPTTLSGYGITDAAEKSHTHTKSQITDFPASLKNPAALTISLAGTSQGAYDGSAAKSINVTPASIGLGNVENTADAQKVVHQATYANQATSYYFRLGNTNTDAGITTMSTPKCLVLQYDTQAAHNLVLGDHNNTTPCLYPRTDQGIRLGTDGARWAGIWSVSGTINTSDAQEKKDIADLAGGAQFIYALRPVTYKFIHGESGRTHWGLVAQDVKAAMDRLGISDMDFAGWTRAQKTRQEEDGSFTPIPGEYFYGLRYAEFVAPLIAAVQSQKQEIDALRARLDALETARGQEAES